MRLKFGVLNFGYVLGIAWQFTALGKRRTLRLSLPFWISRWAYRRK